MPTAQNSPELFEILPGRNGVGECVFSVLTKRTYNILAGKKLERAETARKFVPIDIYYDDGDPEWSTVKFESDLMPFKPATDIIFVGRAYSPGGRAAARFDIQVEVGAFKKKICVWGERRCLYRTKASPGFTEPQPMTELEVRYDYAYGGTDSRSDPAMPFGYPRNQMGRGFAVRNRKESVEGLQLPNFEDPADLLTPDRVVLGEPDRWNEQPLPAGLGCMQKTWYPRCSYVGSVPGYISVDDLPREAALGLVPRDQIALARGMKLPAYDPRFGNGASIGLAIVDVSAIEEIRTTNLTPDGDLKFSLPGETPSMVMDIGFGAKSLRPVLQTICVRLEDKQVDIVWRGMHAYPGTDWLPEMKRMDVEIS